MFCAQWMAYKYMSKYCKRDKQMFCFAFCIKHNDLAKSAQLNSSSLSRVKYALFIKVNKFEHSTTTRCQTSSPHHSPASFNWSTSRPAFPCVDHISGSGWIPKSFISYEFSINFGLGPWPTVAHYRCGDRSSTGPDTAGLSPIAKVCVGQALKIGGGGQPAVGRKSSFIISPLHTVIIGLTRRHSICLSISCRMQVRFHYFPFMYRAFLTRMVYLKHDI